MTVTGEAYETFREVEVGRIYEFKIPGRCVRSNSNAQKNGIVSQREVTLKYKCQFSLATEGWATQLPFSIVHFKDLAQMVPDSWVDIYATVESILDSNERKMRKLEEGKVAKVLKSREVRLAEGDFFEILELLGNHATMSIKCGDKLAVRGCKISEYRYSRKLSTGYVTYIDINPTGYEDLPSLIPPSTNVEAKKAMMADGGGTQTLSVQEAVREVENMIQRLTNEYGTIPTRRNLVVVGKLQPFTETFFDAPYPFFGNEDSPKIKIMTQIIDSVQTLPNVMLWDAPAQAIFRVNGRELMEKWTQCENPSARTTMLGILNACQNKEFKFLGNLEAWMPDNKTVTAQNVKFHVDCVVPL